MTKKRLEEYRFLKGELELLNEKFELPISENVKKSIDVPVYETIEKIRNIRSNRARRVQGEIFEIENFINGIKDDFVRRIFEYRYLQGLSWKVLSKKMYGRVSVGAPIMTIARYLKNIGKEQQHEGT